MPRQVVKAHITFEFDSEFVNDGLEKPMTERELADYARETFIEDIYQLVKYGEVGNAVKVEFVEETASA